MNLEINEVDPAEILSFCRDGIQKNVFKKLRSGGYRISDELDLHGATIKQAKQILRLLTCKKLCSLKAAVFASFMAKAIVPEIINRIKNTCKPLVE